MKSKRRIYFITSKWNFLKAKAKNNCQTVLNLEAIKVYLIFIFLLNISYFLWPRVNFSSQIVVRLKLNFSFGPNKKRFAEQNFFFLKGAVLTGKINNEEPFNYPINAIIS
jgi:hypothetical protein